MASPVTRTIPSLRVSFDEGTLRRGERELAGIKNGMARAISGAINKVIPKVRTRTTRELADVLTAKPNNIRNRITTTKATPQKLRGSANILLRQIALINFKHREKRKKRGWGTTASGTGVEVQIYKQGGAQRFPHAFIAKGKRSKKGDEGNRHIFQRVSNSAGRRVKRFPLVSLKGISLMKEFEKRADMQARVQEFIAGETTKDFNSQVNRLLKRPVGFQP